MTPSTCWIRPSAVGNRNARSMVPQRQQLLKMNFRQASQFFRGEYLTLIESSGHHFLPFLQGVDPILQVSLFMAVACHIVLNVGRRGCSFMLSMLQYIVQLALMRVTPNLSARDQKLMSDFPVDPRSAAAQFQVEGKSVVYAVCPNPKCHCTYKPTFDGDSPIPQYPRLCNHREFVTGRGCKERLTKPRVVMGVELQVPIKTF